MSDSLVYTITLKKLQEELALEILSIPDNYDDRIIDRMEVNRPGMPLAGFYDHYEKGRIQIIGKVESLYIKQLTPEERAKSLDVFFASDPVAVVLSTNIEPAEGMVELAAKYGVPLLRTHENTSEFMARLIAYLNVALAPRITRHGVFVEVYGEGILILGDSGIGKSETAIELVKRGHRLIADDAVELKRVSAKTLVGSAPEIIRHYVELRGIGIIDVRRLFGMGSVKDTEKVDLIINLEPWVQGKMYDRLGMDDEYTDILGIKIPSIIIPVRPGRNLAVILEIAAMNNRQKRMGYNTAVEFNKKLMGQYDDSER
ncbi:MAG: HPr(Ser) kinase/phosphatase [Clostridia bacterium]|nr:HPr(Ser) kinase/phosphatase [Clostridia bacterium]